MQDAFSITQSLGFSYILIDSLCIIQDCNEDWKKEAVRMGTVYTNAVCTIASTGSTSSEGGCFHARSTLSLLPCKVGTSSPDSHSPKWIYARRDDVFDFQRNVDRSPLNTRAWVQQERLFSRTTDPPFRRRDDILGVLSKIGVRADSQRLRFQTISGRFPGHLYPRHRTISQHPRRD